MRKLNISFIITFFVLLFTPVLFFDFRENINSEIDNRQLANNPFKDEKIIEENGSLTQSLENYVADRIGFRNFFIRSYIKLHDKLFDKMVHPIYEYGKDDYVFFVRGTGNRLDNDDFYEAFLNMLIEIKKFCDARKVPFYFAFEPSKSSVLTDKLNEGINYDNRWLDDYLKRISDNGINLVNNYSLLKELYNNGEKIFNQKYDAGHWNDLGAYYGVNNILENMQKSFSNIHINELSDFTKKNVIYDTLPVSEFPIWENGIEYNIKTKVEDVTSLYTKDLRISAAHPYFKYWVNKSQKNNAPRTLVFQGSYMNGYGYKFFQNSLYHYIAIRNYDNILDFEYYYNLFKPECVIFEVTEYTLSRTYFNQEKLLNFKLS